VDGAAPSIPELAGTAALLLAMVAVAIVGCAALVAAVTGIVKAVAGDSVLSIRARVWPRFASAIAVGLLFGLAADLAQSVRTADWHSLAKIAAIAGICLLLDPFLLRGLGSLRTRRGLSAR